MGEWLTGSQVEACAAHWELVERWNRVMNLTRIGGEEAAERHYGESLAVARVLDGARVVDVGSGAGFPGLVCAIARPELSFDLVESHGRKAVFLREAARALGNVRILACRAEELEGGYDWATSRAVDPRLVVECGLARRYALLVGRADVPEGWQVKEIVGSDMRVLALSRVPRETPK